MPPSPYDTGALDIPAAKDFLKRIFNGLTGYVEIRIIPPKGKEGSGVQQFFMPVGAALDDIDGLFSGIQPTNAAGDGIHFGVHPRLSPKGTADQVTHCRVVMADLDFKDLPRETFELKVGKMAELGLAPSMAVESGHGIHLYWILNTATAVTKVKPVIESVGKYLGGDPISDASRTLRLPGTYNTKEEPWVPCRVIRTDDVAYDIDQFHPILRLAPPTRRYDEATGESVPNSNGNGHSLDILEKIIPYWTKGHRHHLAIATAGMLRQSQQTRAQTSDFMQKICAKTKDEDLADRMKAIDTTYSLSADKISGKDMIIRTLGGSDGMKYYNIISGYIARLPPSPIEIQKFPHFEISRYLPVDTFFYRYMAWAYNQCDAPLQYHLACAITLVCSALGNKVWTGYPRRSTKLFPTLYTMLAGKTSRYRKSTSLGLARKLAKSSNIPIFSNNTTSEQLFSRMAPTPKEFEDVPGPKGTVKQKVVAWEGSPWGITCFSEFSMFLAMAKKGYMSDMISFYTDLYDGSATADVSSRETKSSGRYYINNPAISMIVGVTPQSMKEHLQQSSIADGFVTRFLYLIPPPKHEIRSRWEPDQDYQTEEQSYVALTDDITALIKMQGEMVPTKEAIDEHEKLITELDNRMLDYESAGMDNMDALIGRLGTMAIKIAMAYSCAMTKTPEIVPEISLEAMKMACDFVRYIAGTSEPFMGILTPESKNAQVNYQDKVLSLLRRIRAKTPEINRRDLLHLVHLDARQLEAAITTLIEAGHVIEKKGLRGGSVYRLNEVEIKNVMEVLVPEHVESN